MEKSENMKRLEAAVNAMNRINKAVSVYDAGVVTLYTGATFPIPAAMVNAIKADFVAARTELFAALNAISG